MLWMSTLWSLSLWWTLMWHRSSTIQSIIPLVGHQHCSAGKCVPSLGEEGWLQQTAHLVPVGERLCRCCGQPYCHPAERMQQECWCEAKTTVMDYLEAFLKVQHTPNGGVRNLSDWLTYTDPIKATSNQKARPCTRPECIMWNLKGISILGPKRKGRHASYAGYDTYIYIAIYSMRTHEPTPTHPHPQTHL